MTRYKLATRIMQFLLAGLVVFQFGCPGGGGGGGGEPDPTAGLYHNYEEIDAELHQLAASHAQIAQVSSIGKSIEGRDLWAIKISDNVGSDEEETVVALLGGHHAREWIATDVPFLIAKHLLENYVTDASIKSLVDNAEIWIVPLVNPDGHQYSVTSDRLWRKNRRNNGDGTFGVDLNRNYGHKWGGPGSSGDTFSETYRGTGPFSESETQAVRDFLQQNPPKALISYHSFSQLVLYPWGNTNAPAPDETLLSNLAIAMADEIRAVHNVSYTPQQSSDLYLASGDTTDWLYALFNAPAYTIELRPRSSFPGFELPESEIQPTFQENLPAALFLIDWAIQQGEVTM
ncbi:MAG: M14 family metallopeptidase [bacterium]